MFEIGSISKVFTGILLADEIGRGRCRLDDTMKGYLPKSVSVPTGSQITLAHLATHTAGYPREPANLPREPETSYSPADLYTYLASFSFPPGQSPGVAYDYSNVGMGLLGHLIALHEGTDLDRLLYERVAKPLGMESTRVRATPGMASRMASGYDADGPPAPAHRESVLDGAGAISSSARDMLRFMRANLHPDGSEVGKAIALAQQPLHDTDEQEERIGLGWHLDAQDRLFHNGQTGGFHSYLALDRKREVGVVVLTNVASLVMDGFARAVMARLTGEQYTFELPKTVPQPISVLQRYVGRYQVAPGDALEITLKEGVLMGRSSGDSARRLDPESASEFHFRNAPMIRVSFPAKDGEDVSGLVLHFGPKDIPCKRLP
ncbi:MAG: beta-lactamase family protein [Deltaproteobacteria bacterium]|nr:beta-lactamase family protein [Deltaproteobacteria bacterium]